MPRLLSPLIAAVLAALLALPGTARADLTMTDIHAGLTGVWMSAVQWGDFDNDGRLDALVTGDTTFDGIWIGRIYRNTGAGFVDIHSSAITAVDRSAVAWGDEDGDGDLDCFVTGFNGSYNASLLRNDAGSFHRISGPFTPSSVGSLAWLDYDNDGDLDLIESGNGTGLYRNDGNSVFTPVTTTGLALTVQYSSLSCADLDNDGRPDVVFGGAILRNLGGGNWAPIQPDLPNTLLAVNAVGDFDNDGDLDLLVSGIGFSEVLRNDGPAGFVDIHAGIDALCRGSAHWVDFDNDGNLDISITGFPNSSIYSIPRTRLYHNDGAGHFVLVPMDLAPGGSASDWGDFDNDGRDDFLLTGLGPVTGRFSAIYRADGVPTNAPPNAPTGLTSQIIGNQLLLSWDRATDDHTPSLGLSYNVRVGTNPGGNDIVPSMADPLTGFRRIAALGNAFERTWMKIQLPASWDVLYWSVQAIDGQYAGSAFAPEQVISGSVPALPTSVSAEAGPDGVVLVWYRVGSAGDVNRVYRREAGSDWVAVGSASAGDSPQYLSFTDSGVHAGHRYDYRLGVMSGGAETFTEETWVDVPAGVLSFGLDPVAPNPSPAEAIHVSFRLTSTSAASLSLVDTKGRVLSQEPFAGAGSYRATLRPSQRLTSGRYFVRLDQAGSRAVVPLTVVR